jgi:hypothetical protein
MRTRMLQCAAIVGALALVTATGWLGQVRTDAEGAGQVTQYCVPEQNSDAPDSPRVYCHDAHG